jgi:hypothetical protein
MVKAVLPASVPVPLLDVFAGADTSTSWPLEKGWPGVKPWEFPLVSPGSTVTTWDDTDADAVPENMMTEPAPIPATAAADAATRPAACRMDIQLLLAVSEVAEGLLCGG